MALTTAQSTALKAAILANPTWAAFPMTPDGWFDLARALDAVAVPAFIVWRSNVTRQDIYNTTSAEATTWNWTTYKAQAVTEQNAWTQMFMGDRADFSQANLRAGVAAIFGNSNAQTTHILAASKRSATYAEKILAVGTGTLPLPATMGYEGALTAADVEAARKVS